MVVSGFAIVSAEPAEPAAPWLGPRNRDRLAARFARTPTSFSKDAEARRLLRGDSEMQRPGDGLFGVALLPCISQDDGDDDDDGDGGLGICTRKLQSFGCTRTREIHPAVFAHLQLHPTLRQRSCMSWDVVAARGRRRRTHPHGRKDGRPYSSVSAAETKTLLDG